MWIIYNTELLQRVIKYKLDTLDHQFDETNSQYGWWDCRTEQFVEFLFVTQEFWDYHSLFKTKKERNKYIADYIKHHNKTVNFSQDRQYLVRFYYMINKEECWVYSILDCWRYRAP